MAMYLVSQMAGIGSKRKVFRATEAPVVQPAHWFLTIINILFIIQIPWVDVSTTGRSNCLTTTIVVMLLIAWVEVRRREGLIASANNEGYAAQHATGTRSGERDPVPS